MLAKRFAQFILKSRKQAAIVAFLFAWIPFLSWLSTVVVGLVTLRKGAMEGFLVLLWAVLPTVVLTFVSHQWWTLVVRLFLSVFLVYVMIVFFRMKPHWQRLVLLTGLLGLILVLAFHAIVPDVKTFWLNHLSQGAQQFEASVGVKDKSLATKQQVQLMIPIATGLNAAIFLIAAIVQCFFARLLDRTLPKPIHETTENRNLRMPIWASAIAIILVCAGFFSNVLLDAMPVVMMPFFVAGFVLIISTVMKRLSPMLALTITFVFVLAMLLLPMLLPAVAFIAVIDSFINLQQFMLKKRSD